VLSRNQGSGLTERGSVEARPLVSMRSGTKSVYLSYSTDAGGGDGRGSAEASRWVSIRSGEEQAGATRPALIGSTGAILLTGADSSGRWSSAAERGLRSSVSRPRERIGEKG